MIPTKVIQTSQTSLYELAYWYFQQKIRRPTITVGLLKFSIGVLYFVRTFNIDDWKVLVFKSKVVLEVHV